MAPWVHTDRDTELGRRLCFTLERQLEALGFGSVRRGDAALAYATSRGPGLYGGHVESPATTLRSARRRRPRPRITTATSRTEHKAPRRRSQMTRG